MSASTNHIGIPEAAVIVISVCASILAVGFLLDVDGLSLRSDLGRLLQVATLVVGTSLALMSTYPVPRLAAIALLLGAVTGVGSEWISLLCTVGVPEVAWRSVRAGAAPRAGHSARRPRGLKHSTGRPATRSTGSE
jgi:hypothetical protein